MADASERSSTLLPTEPNGVEMMAKFFRALGDPARLRLLEFLLHEEHAVGECVTHIGLSQGRVSSHLACLSDCGYVQLRRQGRFAYYRVTDPASRNWCCWRARWPRTTPPPSPRACASPPRTPDQPRRPPPCRPTPAPSKRTALAAAGFLLVPIVCCGLPVLIAAGALGAVGSVLGNPWVIGTAVVVVLAAVTRFARRRVTRTRRHLRQLVLPARATRPRPARSATRVLPPQPGVLTHA